MDRIIREQITRWNSLYKEQDDFYHKAAQWSGLSDAAYWVLYFMCSVEGEAIQSELCRESFFSKQTINSAVAKLTSQNYVKLIAQNGSGNRKKIVLTTEGERFCDKYVRPIIKAEWDSFVALTDEERELMLSLMRKQITNMKQEAEKLWQ